VARVGLTATTQTDGRVVVIGGGPVGGDPVGAIAVMADVGGATEIRTATVTLATPRRDHAAIRLGDDVGAPVLVVGGVDALGAPVAVAELWKPLSGTLADPATFAPRLVVPRSRHLTRLMPDGSVLVIGGLDGAGPAGPDPRALHARRRLRRGRRAASRRWRDRRHRDPPAARRAHPPGRRTTRGGGARRSRSTAIARLDVPQWLGRPRRHRSPGDPARRPPGGGAVRRHGAGGWRHAGGRGRPSATTRRRPADAELRGHARGGGLSPYFSIL
jgi:hypothetical protein